MDSFGFDNMLESDFPRRNARSKPVKRKWREIEALKDKQKLKKELQDIDILHEFTDEVDL
ncbi:MULTISPECIES: DUF3545 family protein [Photobacterium]|uniref:DUF3545 family protein n=1 Tax=Photobacterium halotolerans TaxID=265726 RepID=A0A0F5VHQ5_9GAMM|nr:MULTISPECIES: DUF3545 family protein [Photobacterium]KKD01701.1 hypothetical protein KY46_02605 [Photobacterium halotolerans]NAW67070.1 DUF3545 family protein [Photobacterium halotolerans]NAW88011.1 DUF3545 family protein [Photobacterium halotolerans]NAX48354.1 DUF3545 family protein [Photobacterium halotolerans]UIP27482.1 DUF3545 family protein [Photobacterium sp. TLY01]